MSSPRVLKLAEDIKVIAAEMMKRRIKDPRLGFVTLTDVRLTGDSRDAQLFYTALGTSEEQANTAAALHSATGMIRSQVGKQLGLKFTPSLVFVPDVVPETARQLEELLAAAKDEDAKLAAQAIGAQYAGEPDPYKRPEDDEDDDERA
jgi:ribosome-binding factor A